MIKGWQNDSVGLALELKEWALLFCMVDVFARFSAHTMPVCQAQNAVGWMLATYPCIIKDALPLPVSNCSIKVGCVDDDDDA